MTKPESCLGCPLYDAPGPVYGDHPLSAPHKLIYIGQNPAHAEVTAGRPFANEFGAGRIFNAQLHSAGIDRTSVYVTNLVKCVTPNNRVPTSAEVAACRHHLDKELRVLSETKVIVLAGEAAMNGVLGKYSTLQSLVPSFKPSPSIHNRAGTVEIRDGRYYLSTVHPAYVMRNPQWRYTAASHLVKALRLIDNPPRTPEILVHPTDSQVIQVRDLAAKLGYYSYDVETRPPMEGVDWDFDEDDATGEADWKVTMCGFGYAPHRAIVIKPHQIPLWAPLFESSDVWRFAHNRPYDDYHIRNHTPITGTRHMDTMLVFHYLYSHLNRKGLKPYALQSFTSLPYYDRGLDKLDPHIYNGMDVVATYHVALQQQKELVAEGVWDTYFRYGEPILDILDDIRRIGVRIDLRRALLIKKIIELRIAKAQEMIAQVCGPLFNPGSPKQVKELLYDKWNLPKQFNSVGRGEKRITTDYEARKRLRNWIEATPEREAKYKLPLITLKLLDLTAGESQKLEFLTRINSTGRINPYYKAHGSSFFRLSSSPNMQNWPVYSVLDWGGARNDTKEDDPTGFRAGDAKDPGSLRSLVIPDTDEAHFLTCDFSQMQLWIYAFQFNVKWLKELFYSGDYIYGVVYEELYKEPFFRDGGRTKKHMLPDVPQQRIRRAKAVPLGFLFGRQAQAVAKEYGWPLQEAVTLRNWWFNLNPELLTSYKLIDEKLRHKPYIKHCFGQKIWYPNAKSTEAINSHAQSPEAFILMGSMISITNELKARNLYPHEARIALTVHDSITLSIQNPANIIPIYEEIVAPILNRSIPELQGLSLRHEAEVSRQWDWNVTPYPKWKEQYLGEKP